MANLPRWLFALPFFLIVVGLALAAYAETLPIYTAPDAPEKLSSQLESLPRDQRFKEWYARLPAYETVHKRLSDWGRGLAAAGVEALLALIFWIGYHRQRWLRSLWAVLLVWITISLTSIPLCIWYFTLRQSRFDYPVWGDSIGIPVIQGAIVCVVGTIISVALLALLRLGHPLPERITLAWPSSLYSRCRAAFLIGWLAILGLGVIGGITDGDEGMELYCWVAAVVLLIFLASPGTSKATEPLHMGV